MGKTFKQTLKKIIKRQMPTKRGKLITLIHKNINLNISGSETKNMFYLEDTEIVAGGKDEVINSIVQLPSQ